MAGRGGFDRIYIIKLYQWLLSIIAVHQEGAWMTSWHLQTLSTFISKYQLFRNLGGKKMEKLFAHFININQIISTFIKLYHQ